jgi:hypothetical protein
LLVNDVSAQRRGWPLTPSFNSVALSAPCETGRAMRSQAVRTYPTGRQLVRAAMRIHPQYPQFARVPSVRRAADALHTAWRQHDGSYEGGQRVNLAIALLNREVEECIEPTSTGRGKR